ncbi:MAG TPA: hypothetical protein VK539_25505 [Myxococcaceae bacterium]|nr:hypothetical protein [Myxococcaceae bacterium]
MPELGHAGVLFINGKTGVTKYYEYGRYDPKALGIVRRVSIPDVTMKNGKPTRDSLKKVVARISVSSGQNGAVSAAYIELPDDSFKKMVDHAERRLRDNGNPNRTPYALLSNSCLHFMKEVAEAGGASMPPGVVPIPKDYMRLVRMVHPKLDYARGIMTVPLPDGGVMQKAAGAR